MLNFSGWRATESPQGPGSSPCKEACEVPANVAGEFPSSSIPLESLFSESSLGDAGGNRYQQTRSFHVANVGLSQANCSARLSFAPVCFLSLTATPSHSCFLSQWRFNKPISKPSRPGAFKDLRLLNVKHLIISDYFQ